MNDHQFNALVGYIHAVARYHATSPLPQPSDWVEETENLRHILTQTDIQYKPVAE